MGPITNKNSHIQNIIRERGIEKERERVRERERERPREGYTKAYWEITAPR